MKIAVATKNQGKLKEFKELASNSDYEFIHLPENIVDLPPETGSSFYENALIKAQFVSKVLGIPAIGDDSGLEVDALEGKPGIYSARYSESGTDQDNCLKLLKDMEPYEANLRSARFRCCLLGFHKGKTIFSEGTLEGEIADSFKGDSGFGYDPIFVPEGYDKTFSELSSEDKNKVSHRGSAMKKLINFLSILKY